MERQIPRQTIFRAAALERHQTTPQTAIDGGDLPTWRIACLWLALTVLGSLLFALWLMVAA